LYRVTRVARQVIGEVGTNVEYAAFQEFGTSKMEPQPFLKPSLDANRTNSIKLVQDEIRKELT
jgi:HK97 gp10 family phage protein